MKNNEPTILEYKILDDRIKDRMKEDVNFHPLTYATNGSSAIDLRAMPEYITKIKPHEHVIIGTGIAINMKKRDMAAMILPRSGLGVKGLVLKNTIGLIDPDYQGELKLALYNTGSLSLMITPYDRVAQLLFIPTIIMDHFKIVDDFESTDRGDGGFGHTGV